MTTRKDKLIALAEHLMAFGSHLFDEDGPDEIAPMFIGEDEKGDRTVIMTPFSSDEEKVSTAKLVQQMFMEKNILRYAFLSEG